MAFVVFAGQSNTGGYGMTASARAQPWTVDPTIQIWNEAGQRWEAMQVGVNTGYGPSPDAWGPEVQFALDFRARFPSEPLHIVKSAHGGTPLQQDTVQWHYDWSPESVDELFDRTGAVVAQAGAALGGARPTAVFWGQGEEDATQASAAAGYQSNLTALFAAIRAEWMGDAAGKIGFFRIGGGPAYAEQVRAGELEVDRQDPNADSFDTAFFPRQSDALHLAAPGHDLSGSAFFHIYAGWRGAGGGGMGAPGETLNGSPGADTLMGGLNADSIAGSWGEDFLRGGEGDDLMSGGDAFDDMHGNQGADTLSGDEGGDWVVGGKGDDRLFGGGGADVVLGNIGRDYIDGGDGDDIVRGGQDDDLVFGGAGNDWLAGDRGADTVSGGPGADTFHIFGEAGVDRVTDFSRADGDRVLVEPGASWAVAQEGGDVVVQVGEARLVLAGVSLGSLGEGWITGG